MHPRFSGLPWVLLIVALALVAGCGDSQESKGPAPKAAVAPSYQATIEEGIDFRREGFPTFIAEVHGLSAREPFGRWSDANLAPSVRFVFRDPLPRRFELVITAFPFDQNEKLPIVVRVGGVEQSFSLEKTRTEQTHRLVFDLPSEAKTVEIVPPKPLTPKSLDAKSGDERRLGIALASLKIQKL